MIGDHCQAGHKAGPLVVLIVPAACIFFATLYLGVIPALLNAPRSAGLLSPPELTLKQHLEEMLSGSDGASKQHRLMWG